MITIDLPDTPDFRADLTPAPRSVRGGGTSSEVIHAPQSWIELSQTTTVSLTTHMTEDKELVNYIAAERGKFRYDYVRLGCSFYSSNGERFDQAWLEVDLTSSDPNIPIAWSMVPDAIHDSVKRTSKAKIGAKLELLSSSMEEDAQFDLRLYSIRGYRESTSKPFWEMKRNDLAELDGLFRFHLIVRSLKQQETIGTVRLSTMIGSRKFLVFRSQRAENAPLQEFRLAGNK